MKNIKTYKLFERGKTAEKILDREQNGKRDVRFYFGLGNGGTSIGEVDGKDYYAVSCSNDRVDDLLAKLWKRTTFANKNFRTTAAVFTKDETRSIAKFLKSKGFTECTGVFGEVSKGGFPNLKNMLSNAEVGELMHALEDANLHTKK